MSAVELIRDPFFGAPLSAPERRLWESILLPRRRKSQGLGLQAWLGAMLRRASTPFGASSGGAGGSVQTSQLGTVPAAGYWPVWLYPTPDFQNFDKYGTVALPAETVSATIGGPISALNASSSMPWAVPQRRNGFIKTMAIEYVPNGGEAWTPGVLPAELTFDLTVNNAAVPDYGNIAYSPGAINAPTPCAGIPIKEKNQVLLTVTNNSLTVTTQYVHARLQGYYYGKQFEPTAMGL
jgi:hypothetical protein